MSKGICSAAIHGAAYWLKKAESMLTDALASKGESHAVSFPGTAYYLPVIHSFTGEKISRLGHMRPVLEYARSLLPAPPAASNWLPYLGNALDAGIAALFACEIIEACKYVIGPPPVDGIFLGAAGDAIMRERGIEFVDGSAPGFAAVTGTAPDNATAVRIARQLQEKNIYVFMAGSSGEPTFAEQLAAEGVQLGWETRLVPFGKDISALVYALGFANRAALSFGGVAPGDFTANLRYNKNRIFAFVLTFGTVSEQQYAMAAGAINYGFPVIADTPIPQILPTGVCTYEHVVSDIAHRDMVEKALEVRGCKVHITAVPVPVPYGPAFEGERIRKPDTQVEFGGNLSPAFEFVTAVPLSEINDGEIGIIGPDADAVPAGSVLPLGIWVEVAGRKMQPDFEPILERQIHHLVNGAEGIWHMGQRDIIWTRISKNGFARGLRLRHYGEIIHAKFLSDYPSLVDKVKVTLITDPEQVLQRLAAARSVYNERDRRLESMTDESVDTFYSCLLCQSFAPNHVCIITPQRLGLCGAYNWLDGRAAHEIDETGPNQPVKKGDCIDPVRGLWRGVNDYVYANSHKTVSSFSLYSIMDRPMTSCGCFEVILAYCPECNGVIAVNREYQGETPVGMTFSTLAGSVGGGQQTPGFLGIGKIYIASKKFLLAEGGHARLVWMTKRLKELLGPDLERRCAEQGVPGLLEKIADETVAVDVRELRAFLERVRHPALAMEEMGSTAAIPSSRQPAADMPEAVGTEPVPDHGDSTGTLKHASPEQESLAAVKERIVKEMSGRLAEELSESIVKDIVSYLSTRYLKTRTVSAERLVPSDAQAASPPSQPGLPSTAAAFVPKRNARNIDVFSFTPPQEKPETTIQAITLGASRAEGGSRNPVRTVGGQNCMPFHFWDGAMPHRPLIAMEVFDTISEKYPAVLRTIYGELLSQPAAMAKTCVETYGADCISIRLDGTHPERGNRSIDQSIEYIGSIVQAVTVPLIVTGHNHFERSNEIIKAVAQAFSTERLLLNWVQQENYRTVAGAALAYNHVVVAQSPIDVNIAKQLNILLCGMGLSPEQIVIDPMTGALGYGLEYCYSVMERIRLTALQGDRMLAFPIIVSTGQECAKVKEYRAPEKDFPAWGDLDRRAMLWELSTAMSLLYAGADICVMYHPEAVRAMGKMIDDFMGYENAKCKMKNAKCKIEE